ncbi:Mif2/CENP-C like-domain-containing protein [Microdochium trichocladiopsis]|uniref:CENP-C homolog n=1 Tax=Microdochium trichocladiopsis TaxID=1682393 RepID=A0A9P8YHD0_9PEZI|nr:Mif2/CENP-C like-domain-containing protein [Microdochium trichocladiopsis]KAH7040414.1 Mif2/CENP-C like-domain-containing protein [Microdochium trichocladiopsis]
MPPKAAPGRRAPQAQPEQIYALGQAGRKTGIVLQDTGERDEHGFENPNIFSSPEKGGASPEEDEDDSGQEMELDDEDEPGPATIRRGAQHRPSLPRARSPLKTNLLSPAKHNPQLNPSSSPTRGDIYHMPLAKPHETVNRVLNFGTSKNSRVSPAPRPKVNGSGSQESPFKRPALKPGAVLNGRTLTDDEDESEPEQDEQPADAPLADDDDDVDLGTYIHDDDPVDVDDDEEPEDAPEEDEPEDEPEEEPEEELPSPVAAVSKARKPSTKPQRLVERETTPVREEVPPPRPRGRPPKASKQAASPKRSRKDQAAAEEDDASDAEAPAAKRAKTKPDQKAPKGKPGRKRKSSGVGVESPAVQRGPPLPKARGLVSIRREGPNSMLTTRSGRHSFKPLNWWQGDQRELEIEEYTDEKGQKFVLNSTKGVVRYENEDASEQSSRRRGGRTGRGGKTVSRRSEPAVEREPWETNTGRIVGECMYWYPEYEHAPPHDEDPVEVVEEELAISEPAIQLKDIKDATFKFAKTLTLPFFGSGIVDLPPGSEKRSKNSRKMQMVFFVHKGVVDVVIATNTFRISEGGQFFVPRGNYYSMANNGDVRARIFFAQGCELQVAPEDHELEGESTIMYKG